MEIYGENFQLLDGDACNPLLLQQKSPTWEEMEKSFSKTKALHARFEEQLSTHRRQTQPPTPTPAFADRGLDQALRSSDTLFGANILSSVYSAGNESARGRASQRTGFLKTPNPENNGEGSSSTQPTKEGK